MEEGQRHKNTDNIVESYVGLNPCCNGRGSKTFVKTDDGDCIAVLILVVMEEGQRQGKRKSLPSTY